MPVKLCQAPTRLGKLCQRRTSKDKCWQHLPKDKSIPTSIPEPIECLLCCEMVPVEDIVTLPHCIHNQFHLGCLTKHFKPECPICRSPHHFSVTGTPPEPMDEIPPELLEYVYREDSPPLLEDEETMRIVRGELIDALIQSGYTMGPMARGEL